MTDMTSRFRLTLGATLIAGTAALAGCGPTPMTRTTSAQQTTTITPPPVVATTTTTTTTEQADQAVVREVPVRQWHRRYAKHHRPVRHMDAAKSTDKDTVETMEKSTTVDTTITPGMPVTTTRRSTETTNVR